MKKGKAIKSDFVIVGNSAGGIGAAEAIREVNKSGSIIMVSDEPYLAYSRPLISEYLSGERTLDQMLFRSADFYEKNDITLMLDKKAVSLNSQDRIIRLESGESIRFRKVLLATGGVL